MTCTATVADVSRNILSVSRLTQKGFSVVFTPECSWITTEQIARATDGEELHTSEGLWYLKVKPSGISTPSSPGALVAAGTADASSSSAPPVAEESVMGGARDMDLLEQVPDMEECNAQYGSLARRDRKAWQYRGNPQPRPFQQRDACQKSDMECLEWKSAGRRLACGCCNRILSEPASAFLSHGHLH
eukprot:3890314-Amphidinium_carterae.2